MRCSLFALLAITGATLVAFPDVEANQTGRVDDHQAEERQKAERFLKVLMKRPRQGTALDQVYGYHVRNQSLPTLREALSDPTSEAARDLNLSDAVPADAKMVLGLLQIRTGHTAAAIRTLKDVETLRPDDAAVCYFLGQAYVAIGETELAAAAFERSIERGPARTEALAVFTELGRIYGRTGDSKKALDVWTKLENLFPGDTRVAGQIATTLASGGNYEEALKRFEALSKSARNDDDRIEFGIQAAEMKQRLGQTEQAINDLEGILSKLRPGSWLFTDVRNRIEENFLKSGDVDALARYYQTKLRQDPDNLELMKRLGHTFITCGKLKDAKNVLLTAVKRAPQDVGVRLELIDLLVRQTQLADAAKQYEELAKQDPSNPDYFLKWGQLLLEDSSRNLADRREAAANVWQRLADTKNDDPVTLAQVADRMKSIDRSEDAIDLYRAAIGLAPEASQYREYLGQYFHQLDRKDEAIEVWESIAEGDRRNVDSLIRLAEIYHTFMMPEKCLAAWTAASEFDLTVSQEIQYARQLRLSENFDAALQRLERAEVLADTPGERERLLKETITTYSEAGTLTQTIEVLHQQQNKGVDEWRKLALMYEADGNLQKALGAIQQGLLIKPENVAALSTIAGILQNQNRLVDAVVYYQKLAMVEQKHRITHLRKVIQLQTRLGDVDEAMKACDELIQANPVSVENFLYVANMASETGRNDKSIEVLRQAISISGQDNRPHRFLAERLANEFRTDEAIELNWQALQLEINVSDRIQIFRDLALLYERRGDIESLFRRLRRMEVQQNSDRTIPFMIAAAYEAIEDYSGARQVVEQLLNRQPQNIDLLKAMVRLCQASSDLGTAVQHQKTIAGLTNRPDDQYRLLNLKLAAGIIDFKTATARQLRIVDHPFQIGQLLQDALNRGDAEAAKVIAREALVKDNSLWDVKLILAQLLLYEIPNVSEEVKNAANDAPTVESEAASPQDQPFDEAMLLCHEVKAQQGQLTTPPPTQVTTPGSTDPRQYTSEYWGREAGRIAQQYTLGFFAGTTYPGRQIRCIKPYSLGDARILAETLTWVPAAKTLSEDNLRSYLRLKFEDFILPKDMTEIKSIATIHRCDALIKGARYLLDGKFTPDPLVRSNREERLWEINWRRYELAPETGSRLAMNHLLSRLQQTKAFHEFESSSKKEDSTTLQARPLKRPQKPKPLQPERIRFLVERQAEERKAFQQDPRRTISQLLSLTMILNHELKLAGQPETAARYESVPVDEDASFDDVLKTIKFHLALGRSNSAEELLPTLLESVRRQQGTHRVIPGLMGNRRNGTFGDLQQDFLKDNVFSLLDAIVAAQSHNGRVAAKPTTAPSEGTFQISNRSLGIQFQYLPLECPYATRLFDVNMAAELLHLQHLSRPNGTQQPDRVHQSLMDHLQKPLPDAPVAEQKSRLMLAAFAHWWDDRPQDCYAILNAVAEAYPEDVDVRIEQARLASELGKDQEALKILDSFEPLDSRTLVRKEMAALNLAVRTSDRQRARQAADRLFGFRLTTEQQLSLNRRLVQLGMRDKANAVLQRLKGDRQQGTGSKLQIAKAFRDAGDHQAAAEVAFEMLRRLHRGTGVQAGTNDMFYRNEAVKILQEAGRLEPLIEIARRRVASSPQSFSAREELADLYSAAGRKKDAEGVWANLPADLKLTAAQLLRHAKALGSASKHEEAVLLFLKAIEKDPRLVRRNFPDLLKEVKAAKAWDRLYLALQRGAEIHLSADRLSDLLKADDRKPGEPYSVEKRRFVRNALRLTGTPEHVLKVLPAIPRSEWKQIPEVSEVVVRAATTTKAFIPDEDVWEAFRKDGQGRISGGLTIAVDVLSRNPKARQAFLQVAEKHIQGEHEGRRLQARLLKSIVQWQSSPGARTRSVRDEILEICQLLNQDFTKAANASTGEGDGQFSSPLLWQAAQIIADSEETEDTKRLALALYECASLGRDAADTTDPQESALVARIELHQELGQPDEAISAILETYRREENTSQAYMFPDIARSVKRQTWKWMAQKLMTLEAPIQGLAIYRRGLSVFSKTEEADLFDFNGDSFETGARNAAKRIDSESAVRYLNWIGRTLDDASDDGPQIELQVLPVSAFENEELIPCFLMAIQTASESADGRDAMKALLSELTHHSKPSDVHFSVPAAAVAIACEVSPDEVAELSETLLVILPTLQQIESGSAVDQNRYKQYLACFAVGLALVESKAPKADEYAERLTQLLSAIAKLNPESNLRLAIESRLGDRRLGQKRMLTQLEQLPDDTQPSIEQINAAMRIAVEAAEAQDIAISTRALKAALGRGFPVSASTSEASNAFDMNTVEGVASQAALVAKAGIRQQVLSLAKWYHEECKLDSDERNSEGPTQSLKKHRELVYDALLNVVASPNGVELWLTDIVPTARTDYFQYEPLPIGLAPFSAGSVLSETAAALNRLSDVEDFVHRRVPLPTPESTGLLVMLAATQNSPDRMVESLKQFEASLESDLPAADWDPPAFNGSLKITYKVQLEGVRRSRLLNLILNVLPEVSPTSSPEGEVVQNFTRRLMQRTSKYLRSYHWTAHHHFSTVTDLQIKCARIAATQGNRTLLTKDLSDIKVTLQNLFWYAGDQAVLSFQSALMRLFSNLEETEDLPMSAELIRQLIRSQGSKRTYDSDISAAYVMAGISTLPDAQQYALLKEITLGRNDSDDVLHWTGLVRAAPIPAPVQSLCPDRDRYQSTPILSEEAPITSTGVVLAELAVKLGHAPDLITELQQRSRRQLDTASLLATLVEMKASENNGYAVVEGSFTELTAKLQKGQPTLIDKNRTLPVLEMVLTIEAMKLGMPDSVADRLTELFRHYCLKSKRPIALAVVDKVRSQAGFGPAANGSAKSALKHFVPISIPHRYEAEPLQGRSWHALQKDGWVSSTAGQGLNLMMLRYPVQGSFTMSATVVDQDNGDAGLVYGGTRYEPQGWSDEATASLLRGERSEKFMVTVPRDQPNSQALQVSDTAVEAFCNRKVYLKDIVTSGAPWAAVSRTVERTIRWKDFRITGRPVIPRKVNLLDETMRGWGLANSDFGYPDARLPKQETMIPFPTSETETPPQAYEFEGGILKWKHRLAEDNPYRSDDEVQYLRPILNGEQLTWKFLWKADDTEVHPSVGRLIFDLSQNGVQLRYKWKENDLSVTTVDPSRSTLFRGPFIENPVTGPSLPEVSPPKEGWNTVTMSRQDDRMTVLLNGEEVVSFGVTDEMARPGFVRRRQRLCQIKDMVLTGDWPETLPEDLMEPAE